MSDNLSKLSSIVVDANIQRDININMLKELYAETGEPQVKLNILKAMDDVLKSKESSVFNNIKATLMSKDVSSNVDYKKAAIEMLKTITPANVIPGEVKLSQDIDKELETRFSESGELISEHETALED